MTEEFEITLEYALEYLRAPHVPCEHTNVCVARVVDALADMRTLDEWAASDDEHVWHCGPTYMGKSWYCSLRRAGQTYSILAAHGATPEEARAKAAAWVREQSRG